MRKKSRQEEKGENVKRGRLTTVAGFRRGRSRYVCVSASGKRDSDKENDDQVRRRLESHATIQTLRGMDEAHRRGILRPGNNYPPSFVLLLLFLHLLLPSWLQEYSYFPMLSLSFPFRVADCFSLASTLCYLWKQNITLDYV